METKVSIPLDSNTGQVIRDAGYPSTPFPIRLPLEAPYAAGPQPVDIYAREDDPQDLLHYTLRARFASLDALPVVGGAARLENEFTIDVDLSQKRCEAVFTVNPPPRP